MRTLRLCKQDAGTMCAKHVWFVQSIQYCVLTNTGTGWISILVSIRSGPPCVYCFSCHAVLKSCCWSPLEKACLAATCQMPVICRAQGQGCHRWPSGQSQGRSCSETVRLARPISSSSNCATAHQSARDLGESALLARCCSNSLYHGTEAPSRQQREEKESISA